jgi:hypothetical protein
VSLLCIGLSKLDIFIINVGTRNQFCPWQIRFECFFIKIHNFTAVYFCWCLGLGLGSHWWHSHVSNKKDWIMHQAEWTLPDETDKIYWKLYMGFRWKHIGSTICMWIPVILWSRVAFPPAGISMINGVSIIFLENFLWTDSAANSTYNFIKYFH